MRCHTEALMLVEATRENSGPAQHAVVEMGSPPLGLPTGVERRREHRVTGAGARTDRRSLETMVPTPQEAASQSRPCDSATKASQEEHIGKRVCQQRSQRSVP